MLPDRAARADTRTAITAFGRRWKAAPPLAGLTEALDALADPDAATVAALIEPVLAETGWVRDLVAALAAQVARDSWFDPPFAPLRSEVQAGLMLYRGRHAAIALGVGALDRLAAKKRRRGGGAIAFPGHTMLIRVIEAGGATLSVWRGGWRDGRCDGAPLDRCEPARRRELHDGALLRFDPGTSFLVEHARADMLLLHATIFAGAAPTACEYDRDTRALVGTGAASDRASRMQMLASLLGALGRADRPAFEAASRAPEPFVRWHAMREWLALDADAAWPRLAGMAAHDPDAELRDLAAETMALIAGPAACRA